MGIQTWCRGKSIKLPSFVFAFLLSTSCFPLTSPLLGGPIKGWGVTALDSSGFIDNDFSAIAAGASYSLAFKPDGSIVGWGLNGYGQATPPSGNDFVAIAAGGSHSLALKSDGSIVGWGWNGSGQATPPDGNGFVSISAGGYHSLALYGINFFDLGVFANQWNQPCSGPGWCRGYDFNHSGWVDFADFDHFADLWLGGP